MLIHLLRDDRLPLKVYRAHFRLKICLTGIRSHGQVGWMPRLAGGEEADRVIDATLQAPPRGRDFTPS
jgi:hypothetical protein